MTSWWSYIFDIEGYELLLQYTDSATQLALEPGILNERVYLYPVETTRWNVKKMSSDTIPLTVTDTCDSEFKIWQKLNVLSIYSEEKFEDETFKRSVNQKI